MHTKRLRSVDLFSGAGLLGFAFRTQGFHAALAVEADARAALTFKENVGAEQMTDDVETVIHGLKCDIIVAGPPCQGFSSLGKRDALDERNELSLCIGDWAKACRPAVVVVENVPPFLSSPQYRRLKKRMTKMGFASTEWILNSADFGAPQLRMRAFVIFSKIGIPSSPKPDRRKHRTVGDAFRGLPLQPDLVGLHVAPTPSSLALKRFKLIPAGGDKRDVMLAAPEMCPPSWGRMGAQATDVWGRMDLSKPANTLRCSFQNASKGRYVHPTEDRVLTLREGARIQGIPDNWQFHGDRCSIARQIGNGVPIHLGTAVAKSIRQLF